MTFGVEIAFGAVGIIVIEFLAVLFLVHKAPLFDENDK